MSSLRSAPCLATRIAIFGLMAWAATGASAAAQGAVTISVPSAVSFQVHDVTISTGGMPNPMTITYSNATLLVAGRVLRVSVKADLGAFTPPSGSSIPASNVSWTTPAASNGTGSSGTLSSSAYRLVYQSNPAAFVPLPFAGSVELAWTLAAPGAGIRAGVHSLTVRWKLESF